MRHRNMYYLTGMPGWMRFGYSPGWVGRSASGLGPGAEYLMTGRWPMPAMSMDMPGYPMEYGPGMAHAPEAMREQQLTMLRQQAEFIRQQLEQINAQIEQFE